MSSKVKVRVNCYLQQDELKKFISQRCPDLVVINIKFVDINTYEVSVPNFQHAQMLCNFNQFNSQQFPIQVGLIDRPTFDAQKGIIFEQIKYRHFNIKERSLDLSNFGNKIVDVVQSFNLNVKITENDIENLMVECLHYFKMHIHDLLRLSISNNGFKDHRILKTISSDFKRLQTLDITNNRFTHPKDLMNFKNSQLKELNIIGNGYNPDYVKMEFTLNKTPLEIMDGQLIKMRGAFIPTVSFSSRPINFTSIYPKDMKTYQLILMFIQNFLNLHDKNIDQLRNLYSNESVFTFTAASRDLGISLKTRNLKDMKNFDSVHVQDGFAVGQERIYQAIRAFGGTQHDMMGLCYDAVQIIENIYSITMMGPIKVRRNKDVMICRTLIVNIQQGPNGMNCMIANDHVHMMNYNNGYFPFIKTYKKYIDDIQKQHLQFSKIDIFVALENNNWDYFKTEQMIQQQQQQNQQK